MSLTGRKQAACVSNVMVGTMKTFCEEKKRRILLIWLIIPTSREHPVYRKTYSTVVLQFISNYLDKIQLNILAIGVLENEIIFNTFF
jgi:hypothetical protein